MSNSACRCVAQRNLPDAYTKQPTVLPTISWYGSMIIAPKARLGIEPVPLPVPGDFKELAEELPVQPVHSQTYVRPTITPQ